VNDERGIAEEQQRQFTNGFLQQLHKNGYECFYNGNEIDISKNSISMMSLRPNGDFKRYDTAVNECIYEIRDLREKVKEAYDNYFNAVPLEYENLSRYRRLAAFNGIVLAARMMNDSSCLEFVTWRQTHGNTGVESGNYFSNYEAAKEDFATRGGLVNRYKMFSETEMKLLRQGLVFLGKNSASLTAEQMTNVGKIIEKIEMIIPAIQARSAYEAHDLVPEDGLEV